MRVSEIVDRYTILQLKLKHGLNVGKEHQLFKEAIKGVSPIMVRDLYKINEQMWAVEELAEKATRKNELGRLFEQQRHLNKKRVNIKNKIAKAFNEAEELKSYGFSGSNKQ